MNTIIMALLAAHLLGVDGKKWDAGPVLKEKKFLVFVSAGSSCPMVRRYAPILTELKTSFNKDAVEFYMIFPSKHETLNKVRVETREFSYGATSVLDVDRKLSKALGFTTTTQAAVVDVKQDKVVYLGPIDDRFTFEGDKEGGVQNYLKDAVRAAVKGSPIVKTDRLAYGCAITY